MANIRHKFNAVRVEADNRKFASKKECAYYQALKSRKQNGEVILFLWQTPFHSDCGVKYIVDFVEFRSDGTVHFIDVKGFPTETYKIKKKLIENEFQITIEEV